MVKCKTVDEWNLACFSYTYSNEVDLLHCRICRYYCGDKLLIEQKKQLQAYIDGTKLVKKCNTLNHVVRGAHNTALLALTDDPPQELGDLFGKKKIPTSAESDCSTQSTIRTTFRKLTAANKEQLLKKFQLVHFVGVSALFHNMYEKIAKFEKNIHRVNVYCLHENDTLFGELKKNVTESLNSGKCHYYYLLSDGSSNAKTLDEKELFVIKTCDEGLSVFNVLGSMVVEERDRKGIVGEIQGATDKAS